MGTFVDVHVDVFGMIRLAGDGPDCEPYHGVFAGTYFHIVGLGTEYEKLFLRSGRRAAIDYAKANGDLPISNLVLARSLCHETVLAVLGA